MKPYSNVIFCLTSLSVYASLQGSHGDKAMKDFDFTLSDDDLILLQELTEQQQNRHDTKESLKAILEKPLGEVVTFLLPSMTEAIAFCNRIRVNLSRVRNFAKANNVRIKEFKLKQDFEVKEDPETGKKVVYVLFKKYLTNDAELLENFKQEYNSILMQPKEDIMQLKLNLQTSETRKSIFDE